MNALSPSRSFGSSRLHLLSNASKLSLNMARGMRPPPRLTVSEWASTYRRFAEDSAKPGPWRHQNAPYLVEIMDRLSPHDPCEQVTIMKCAQSGGSASGENWIGYVADITPGPMMYVAPTITSATQWLAEKFWPMVESSPRLNPYRYGAIMPKRSRDGDGSTALRVQFRKGSYMLIAGANSAATLRQHSIRYVIEDDLDQFPDDLDKQGSPEAMITARLRTFAVQGLSKRLKISTPTIKGGSKIERSYNLSDQRRLYLPSPHTGDYFDPIFSDLNWPAGRPHEVVMLDPTCPGAIIEHWQKYQMLQSAVWIPTAILDPTEVPEDEEPSDGPPRVIPLADLEGWRTRSTGRRQPGYHLSGIVSAFMSWEMISVPFVNAQNNQNALKAFTNLDLGDPYEVRGDAPPADALEALREQDWGGGQMPWGPTVFTMGCDVQGDGIYYKIEGHGPDFETWHLDHGWLTGPTDVAHAGAWARLETVAQRPLTMPGGRALPLDQICVDAGFNTDAARAFCKRSANRMAVFGRPGWALPILGRGQAITYLSRGKRAGQASTKANDKSFLVGTFGAKLNWFGFLRANLEAAADRAKGQEVSHFAGRQHFGLNATAELFDHLTSESCVYETRPNGMVDRVWRVIAGRQNHWLDCRIYNMAAMEALRLTGLSDQQWLRLRADRYAAVDPSQGDLVELMTRPGTGPAQDEAADDSGQTTTEPARVQTARPEPKSTWIEAQPNRWL